MMDPIDVFVNAQKQGTPCSRPALRYHIDMDWLRNQHKESHDLSSTLPDALLSKPLECFRSFNPLLRMRIKKHCDENPNHCFLGLHFDSTAI